MNGGKGPRPQLLLALCAAGFAVFNFPLLLVWDAQGEIFGLPSLPALLFLVWAALIAALALVSARGPEDGER